MADLQNPYRQIPSETGGQAYHMECVFCHEWHSMYSSAPFMHAIGCPAGMLEREEFLKRQVGMKQGTIAVIVLGIIAVVIVGYVLFWGTVGAVAYHFIYKLW